MTMNANFREAAGRLAAVELAVKGVLTREGVMPGLNHFYMDFGQKVAQLKRKHSAKVACNEADIAMEKWRQRGLDLNVLEAIKDMMLPCGEGAVQPFRCDVSLLDGEDVLN